MAFSPDFDDTLSASSEEPQDQGNEVFRVKVEFLFHFSDLDIHEAQQIHAIDRKLKELGIQSDIVFFGRGAKGGVHRASYEAFNEQSNRVAMMRKQPYADVYGELAEMFNIGSQMVDIYPADVLIKQEDD